MKKVILLFCLGILSLGAGVGAGYLFDKKAVELELVSQQPSQQAAVVEPSNQNEQIPKESPEVIEVTQPVIIVAGDSVLASARDSRRRANVSALANAAFQFDADGGNWSCAGGLMPKIATSVKSGPGGFNALACLVPDYLAQMVIDPSVGHWTSVTDYNSGYSIYQDAQGKFVVVAPFAENGEISGRSY